MYDCVRFPCLNAFLFVKTALHPKERIFRQFLSVVGAGVLNIQQERDRRKVAKRRLSGLLRFNSCQATLANLCVVLDVDANDILCVR